MTWATLPIDRRFCGPPGSGGRAQIMERLVQRLGDAGALAVGLSRRDAADLLVAATAFAGWDQIVTARGRSPATATKLIVRMALRAVT